MRWKYTCILKKYVTDKLNYNNESPQAESKTYIDDVRTSRNLRLTFWDYGVGHHSCYPFHSEQLNTLTFIQYSITICRHARVIWHLQCIYFGQHSVQPDI